MRRIWTPILIIVALTGVIGFFQNCTPAVPFGTTDHYTSLVNSPTFPYEASIDQVAYMSCSEQEDVYNDGTFFTFRVGSFDSKGIRISRTYRENIEKMRDVDVPPALSQAVASSRLKLLLAIRTLNNLQLLYTDNDNGEDGLNGSDFNTFFPVMGDESLNELLWYMAPGEYLRNYAAARNINEYRFEGELKFMKSQIMENDLRNFMTNRGILAVTWAAPGETKPIGEGSLLELQSLAQSGNSGNSSVAPIGTSDSGASGNTLDGSAGGSSGGNLGSNGGSTSPSVASASATVYAANNNLQENVFGAAIQPRFKQPGFNPGSDLPPRALSNINDVIIDDRMRGVLQQGWRCDVDLAGGGTEDLSFMIVLPEDAIYQDANSNTVIRCAMDPDPINPSQDLQIIRQSLYAEDFYVDLLRRCIVPKPGHTSTGSCYGTDSATQLTHQINYDSYAANGCGFGNPNGLCPHFASVCYRER